MDRQMKEAKLYRKDQAAIAARLQEAGIQALTRGRGIYAHEIHMTWRDGTWNCWHQPGLKATLRSWEHLEEIVRVATLEVPEPAQSHIEDILEVHGELQDAYEGMTASVEAALRYLAGCASADEEIITDLSGDIGGCAQEVEYQLVSAQEFLQANRVEKAS